MAKILVVGAGPVGLTCAVELARRQQNVVIIEQKSTREHVSKAIGINARSLELLENSEVTSRLIAEGVPIQKVHIHYTPTKEICLNLAQLHHRYNFMLSLPQDHTEGILEQRLDELDVHVQRETQLIALNQTENNKVIATVESKGQRYELIVDFVVGADGAHSTVRKQIGQEFTGTTLPEKWNLVDVHMQWPYNDKEGHGFIIHPGVIGVVLPIGKDHYRLVANHPNAFDILPKPYTIDKIIWQSDFSISCRLVSSYQKGRVFLAGDSAHIHTPVGGRGMNLGIEDACVLARLLSEGGWENYSQLRHPVGQKVVAMTSRFYKIFALKNPIAIALRNTILFPLMRLPFIQKKQIQKMVGL